MGKNIKLYGVKSVTTNRDNNTWQDQPGDYQKEANRGAAHPAPGPQNLGPMPGITRQPPLLNTLEERGYPVRIQKIFRARK